MQPPPPTAPAGVPGPPPMGTPRGTVFWSSSPYRRRAPGPAPSAPVTCPLQPVTDPFAFSRQVPQEASLDPGPGLNPRFPQQPALSPSQGPCEPGPTLLPQPGMGSSPFTAPLTSPGLSGPESDRSPARGPASVVDLPSPPDPPQFVPRVNSDSLQGVAPGPARPLSRQDPHDRAGAPSTTSFPQPSQQVPGPWPPAQGGLQPPHHGAVRPHLTPQPGGHQGLSHEQHYHPPAPGPGPWAEDERSEAACLQSGGLSATPFDPENTFRQSPRVGPAWVSPGFRQSPGEPAVGSPLAQGHSAHHRQHYPPWPGPSSGAGSLLPHSGEAENEEDLSRSTESVGTAGPSSFDAFAPGQPPPAAHLGPGSLCQPALQGPSGETSQPATGNSAVEMWGGAAGGGTHSALGSRWENVENLEFVQNQEVLPSEPLPLPPSPPSEPFRYSAHSGHRVTSHTGAGGPHRDGPNTALLPLRPEGVPSSYGSQGSPGGSALCPQELAHTFIQQEVGKPEEEAPGSFFQQIDSSPVGAEIEAAPGSQPFRPRLPPPSTPSPPKPTGVFQTSANSSFEPVSSHMIGVKPMEADQANVVGEVRGSHTRQRRPRGPAAPGNLEQPPDNMETLFMPLAPGSTVDAGHGLPHGGRPSAETRLATPEKRPSARAHGTSKCESPATTLWAQNELPDFGGNVLLAPAAPVLYVPVKPQAPEVVQPPDEGLCGQQSHAPGPAPPNGGQEGVGASENLENPPKVGEEEAGPPQASSGSSHMALLASPPPGSVCSPQASAAPPSSLSVSSSGPHERGLAQRDSGVGGRPACGEGTPSLRGLPGAHVSSTLPGILAPSGFPQAASPDRLATQPASTLAQPPPAGAQRSRDAENVPPPGAVPGDSSREVSSGALDFTMTKPGAGQKGAERAQPEVGPPPQPAVAPPQPRAALLGSPSPGSPPAPDQAHGATPQPAASPALADPGQQAQPCPPRFSSVSVTSTNSSQVAGRSELPWPPLPADYSSYYYYRPFYDAYSQYPPQYPPEPATAPAYYQDTYSAYRPYDSADGYRCPEPERPSSRASHCSDRPAPRPGYPEGYYSSKGGWSSQSDYYASYYSGQYDYGDPARWDPYHYTARFRDARAYDRKYWYDAQYSPYRKEPYAYGDRADKDEDSWRYDPRFASSFEEDLELHRDPYGEEGDRHSVHSEHSAQSLHSRRSSFSTHSQQSQIHRNHHMEAPAGPSSFHGDYSYGAYGGNFNSLQGFPEYGYPADASWPTTESAPSRPTSPEKFSVPHVCARFGPGGQLVKVIPNLPSEGQPALVEVHSMEVLLQHSPEQDEMRAFPGPLGKCDTHKVDVINFAQNKATRCLQSDSIVDRESASLLWSLIVLLCRQNGTVVGTDIAELLLRDHKTVWLPGKSPNEANLIDFTSEAVEQVEEEESGEAQLSFLTDSQAAGTEPLEQETEHFRELLLYGRRKDALESAMKKGLWGHALLLASKMDSRTHARVMTRFANSLPINDPLQTVYQLLSGRMPAASTCCGDEKWGDWRSHLAMVLSNLNDNLEVASRTMVTMGDTLAAKGLLGAAHFCYLMAQAAFGVYTKKSAKLVLIGSNHSLPFSKFAINEAIQRTEAYEYAQSLGAHTCSLPHFQVFKFIYACRLADMGLATQAFHYCEVIAKSVLAQPQAHSAVLISQLVQVASKLRLFDPQLKERPEEEAFVEPAWLVQLQQEGATVWWQDGALSSQGPATPSSEAEPCEAPGPQAPLLALPLPGTELSGPGVHLLPSAPQTPPARAPMLPVPPPGLNEPGPGFAPPVSAIGFPESPWPDPTVPCPGLPQDASRWQDPGTLPQELPRRDTHSELREEDFGGNTPHLDSARPPKDLEPPLGWEQVDSGGTAESEPKRPVKGARKEASEPKKSAESWFSRWLPGKKKTEAYLPDDKNKSIVWDEQKNQWVNLNEPEEGKKAPPPPPTAFPKAPQAAPPGPGGPPRAAVNVFSRKAGGTRARYVDVLNPSGTTRGDPVLAPAEFFAPLAPLPIPVHVFAPGSDTEEPQSPGVGSPGGQAAAGGQTRPEPTSETKTVTPAARSLGSKLPPCSVDTSRGGEVSLGYLALVQRACFLWTDTNHRPRPLERNRCLPTSPGPRSPLGKCGRFWDAQPLVPAHNDRSLSSRFPLGGVSDSNGTSGLSETDPAAGHIGLSLSFVFVCVAALTYL
ncbi:protein transport protein Sec16A isoform X3 [Echinops telfairi]|uniref:Protein transport protein Sec16A isoform X3 n=1 Tax=Echinops telfairi TaxID=9371 RepID=A0AC55D071_ECHTE|nr:protein transport protein Sec16A isoform X3 [Echinops telfairi]